MGWKKRQTQRGVTTGEAKFVIACFGALAIVGYAIKYPQWAIGIAVVIAGLVAMMAILKKKRGGTAEMNPNEIENRHEWSNWIKPKESPLSKREWNLYGILDQWARPQGFRILANLNLYAIMRCTGTYGPALVAWRKIQSKQVDFACVDADGRTLWCLELDDSTHDNEDGKHRDTDKNEAFAAAGIPLFRTRNDSLAPDWLSRFEINKSTEKNGRNDYFTMMQKLETIRNIGNPDMPLVDVGGNAELNDNRDEGPSK